MRHSDTSLAISANAIASNAQQPQPLTSPPSSSSSRLGTVPQYVWVTDPTLLTATSGQENFKVGDKVCDRYWVISSHIWQDTQPLIPCNPNGYPLSTLSTAALAYLRLQSYSLHLPTLYGVLSLSHQSLTSSSSDPKHSDLASAPLANEMGNFGGRFAPPEIPSIRSENHSVLLLDNVPVDRSGQLLPSLPTCWTTASPVRQVYWLWQILELWQVLSRWEQTSSLLAPMNIRVDGWRIRLVNVWSNTQWRDTGPPQPFSEGPPLMAPDQTEQSLYWHLGRLWQSWVDQGHPALVGPLTRICKQLQCAEFSWRQIKQGLNILLLQQAVQKPLHLAIAGGSCGITQHGQQRDLCYPNSAFANALSSVSRPATSSARAGTSQVPKSQDAKAAQTHVQGFAQDSAQKAHQGGYDVSAEFIAPQPWEELDPYVAILCDGVDDPSGDAMAGVMASQLVTRSLKLQLGAFLTEIESHKTLSDLITPDVLADQLAAIVRIVNNVLLAQNRSQQASRSSLRTSSPGQEIGKYSRQECPSPSPSPMSTTATFAIQIPQAVTTSQGPRNGHELYVASVGNSRAYWLTPTHYHCLTQDDNVAARTVLSQVGRGRWQGGVNIGESLQHFPGQRGMDQPRVAGPPQVHHQGQSYHDAQLQAGASCLTQALGTKEGEQLTIQVRRLIVDEDGLLLLCSPALGDRVESHWQSITTPILQGQLPLEQAVQEWLDLRVNDDSHKDASVVLMRCQVSDSNPVLSSITPCSEMPETTQMALEHAMSQSTAQQATEDDTNIPPSSGSDLDRDDVPKERAGHNQPRPFDWMSLLGNLKFPQAKASTETSTEAFHITFISEDSMSSAPELEIGSEVEHSHDSNKDTEGRTEDNHKNSNETVDHLSQVLSREVVDRPDPDGAFEVLADSPLDPPPLDKGHAINKADKEEGGTVDQNLRSWPWFKVVGGCVAVMVGAIALGLATWRYLDPVLFDRMVVRSTEHFIESVQEKYPWLGPSSNTSGTPQQSDTEGDAQTGGDRSGGDRSVEALGE